MNRYSKFRTNQLPSSVEAKSLEEDSLATSKPSCSSTTIPVVSFSKLSNKRTVLTAKN